MGDDAVKWRPFAPPANPPSQTGDLACVVAIPARDEEQLIRRCLEALADQRGAPRFGVVVFLNNCADDTASQVAAVRAPFPLWVHQSALPEPYADAAWARRLALNGALALARPDGLVLSTDADSYAEPYWIKSMLAASNQADLICGFVAPDFTDAPPLGFTALRHAALEFEYSQLSAELATLVDPDPHDPWPSHMIETGANMAIRADVLRALGGVPHVCPGEDQALAALAKRRGYRVRHDFAPRVTTSSRLRGRAAGGWSDDLSARVRSEQRACSDKLEPAATTARRAMLRNHLRTCFGQKRFAACVRRLAAPGWDLAPILTAAHFEEAWGLLEDACPMLRRRPLWADALEREYERLRILVDRARQRALSPAAAPHHEHFV